jgi:hypothetical protein
MRRGGGEGGRGISFSRIGGFPDRKVGSMMRGFWARSGPVCPNPMRKFDDATRKIRNVTLKFRRMREPF